MSAKCDVPHLGLATTDQLLAELIARFEVGLTGSATVDERAHAKNLHEMKRDLSDEQLAYKTVGGKWD